MVNADRPARDGARERGRGRMLGAVVGAGALAVPIPLTLNGLPDVSQVLLGAPPSAGMIHDVHDDGELYARETISLVNGQRTANGCPQLTLNVAVETAAYQHSRDMGVNGYFAHDTPGGVTPWTRMADAGYTSPAAENIAEGYRTPQEVVDGWMNDPPHRANILNCSYKASGVGYFDGAPGNAAGPWWTEDFGFD